ncbi:ABC transporter ATP-binding protein [Candidatus Micrarchaeota archaeon]|nr:ABC transporter ATP-binding protein [Candidatus Micrarchaeota archaeon]
MDAVVIKDLKKSFSNTSSRTETKLCVLDGLSFKVKKGEFVGVIGPNGCGKTTLLKLLVGAQEPDEGEITLFGKSAENTRVGFVPQHVVISLYPWFTARQNIAFADSFDEKALEKANAKLSEFNLEKYADYYPYQLSGGLKQLVNIARATLNSELFLFDEPFNALDYQNRLLVEQAFLKLKNGVNTALMISHDVESVVLLCDKIIVLSDKPTKIKAVLPVNLPAKRDANTRFTPAFNLVLSQVYSLLRAGE